MIPGEFLAAALAFAKMQDSQYAGEIATWTGGDGDLIVRRAADASA